MLKTSKFTKEKILNILKLKSKGESFIKIYRISNVQSEKYTNYMLENNNLDRNPRCKLSHVRSVQPDRKI